ncbi:uncharacterized protein LOC129257544 [Lytechinus pictus]|uniref:uncharacterized protein LOC129257544 n=1 Tax=Lytechinus pictus TaxID=7653 RepID=UPI0030B9B671
MSDTRPARRHACGHNHGESPPSTGPVVRPRCRRTASVTAAIGGLKGQSSISRPIEYDVIVNRVKSKKKKSSTSRKRGASPERSSPHGFLQHLVATDAESRKDTLSPTLLNIGEISLVDERGDADTLFVRRKSPRHDVTQATLHRSSGRTKTASPSRSSSKSPHRRGKRSPSPKRLSPLRASSAPGHHILPHNRRSSLGDSILDERRQSTPWSITELQDDERSSSATPDTRDEHLTTADDITATPNEDEEASREKEGRVLKDPIKEMMSADDNEDDYDTDLEEHFPPKPRVIRDASGRQVYVQKCKEEGVDPASYVLRHLTDPAFQLRHRYLDAQNIVPLTKAMKNNSMIETLDLCDNHLQDDSGIAIATMLENNVNITKVDISHNLVRGRGITAFSDMLESNYTLKTLCLRANHLTDKDAMPLAEALKNNATLTELDLSYNELGEMAGIHLGSGLAVNDGLNYLDLRWNAVRNKGIAALANALKVNTILEVLDLSNNGVSVPGCIALMRALKINTGLRILNLSYNHINSVGAQKLSIGIKKNSRLAGLLLTSNPIGDEGMVALCKAFKLNPTLRLVALQNIPMPLIIHQKIRDVMEAKDIHVLKLDVDGHKRNIPPSHVAAMVDQFICDNQSRILSHCLAQDIEATGNLSVVQIKKALWDSGLDVSEEQLDTALRQTKVIKHRTVPYRPMLDGLSALLMLPSWKAPPPRLTSRVT